MALPFIVWLFLFRLLPNSGPNLPLGSASASSRTAVASAARHRFGFSHRFDSTESAVALPTGALKSTHAASGHVLCLAGLMPLR